MLGLIDSWGSEVNHDDRNASAVMWLYKVRDSYNKTKSAEKVIWQKFREYKLQGENLGFLKN